MDNCPFPSPREMPLTAFAASSKAIVAFLLKEEHDDGEKNARNR